MLTKRRRPTAAKLELRAVEGHADMVRTQLTTGTRTGTYNCDNIRLKFGHCRYVLSLSPIVSESVEEENLKFINNEKASLRHGSREEVLQIKKLIRTFLRLLLKNAQRNTQISPLSQIKVPKIQTYRHNVDVA